MKNLTENFKGIYLYLINDNSKFEISLDKFEEKKKKFPHWMQNQINDEFSFFKNKKMISMKQLKILKKMIY